MYYQEPQYYEIYLGRAVRKMKAAESGMPYKFTYGRPHFLFPEKCWLGVCSDEGLCGFRVKVRCSMDWVMISVSPCGYSSSLYIFADELYLGSGCPVTRIQTYAYDFIYPVHDCGIRIQVVSEDTLLFQTEMYFNPRNLHCDHQKIPLECSASRKSVWLTPVSTENEIKLDPSPFIADFETTPEELGLLSSSQTGFFLKEEWRLGTGVMNFVGKTYSICNGSLAKGKQEEHIFAAIL
ncbi:hypothetical protein GH733_007484 [Mirounga leonina]|nr:hypothetical protein GH733_007484 [Mirounga leonina]